MGRLTTKSRPHYWFLYGDTIKYLEAENLPENAEVFVKLIAQYRVGLGLSYVCILFGLLTIFPTHSTWADLYKLLCRCQSPPRIHRYKHIGTWSYISPHRSMLHSRFQQTWKLRKVLWSYYNDLHYKHFSLVKRFQFQVSLNQSHVGYKDCNSKIGI